MCTVVWSVVCMRKVSADTAVAISNYVMQPSFLDTVINAKQCTSLVVALHTLGAAHTFRSIKAVMSRCVTTM